MAKKAKYGVRSFNLNNSELVQENERILNQPSDTISVEETDITAQEVKQPAEKTSAQMVSPAQVEQPEQPAQEVQQMQAAPAAKPSTFNLDMPRLNPLKSEKGVKVMLPIDYYFKLVRIKECTGKTLQELSVQGVMEFIDKYYR